MDLRRGFWSLLSGRVLLTVIGTVSLPFVVRVLGPDGYGEYAFLMSSFAMVMLLVSPVVTEGVQKFAAEARPDSHWREHVVGFYLKLAVAIAVVGSFGLAVVTWGGVVGRVFGHRFDLLFLVLAVYVVPAQLASVTRHSLLGLGLEPFSESFSVGRKVVRLVVGLGLATLGFGVAGFLVGHVVAATLVTVAGVVVLRRELSLSETVRAGPGNVPAREMLSFNGYNVVLVVLMQSLFHTDVLLLQYFVGSEGTGYYKAALVLAEYIWLVPLVLQRLLLHSASQLWSDGRADRIQELAARLTRYVFLSTALLALGVFVLADRFVPLYFGPEYRASVRPLAVLLPGAVGFALARPIYAVNQATGRLRPLVGALAVAAAVNLGLNAVLIPAYGLTGAALATSVGYGSMVVLQVGCASLLGYSPLRGLRPLRLLATVVIGGAAIVAIERVVGGDLLALAVVPPLGLAVFTAVSVLTGAVDASELRDLTSVLPPPVDELVRSYVFDG
jgi:O-antigen/teichoic acid export membrane protein